MSEPASPTSDRRIAAPWKDFVEGSTEVFDVRAVILASWRRSRAAGVDAHAPQLTLRRVSESDLAQRLAANETLIEIARPHLKWLAAANVALPHTIALVDRDGVVLHSTNAYSFAPQSDMLTGFEWSEAALGTNGAGTALAAGEGVVVEGEEHYARALHGQTCVGAPVRGVDGEVVGAIALTSSIADGASARLALVAHAAYAVGQELRYRESLRRAAGELADGQRVAEESARRLAALEALHESEARFRGAFDHSSIGSAITSPTGVWIRVNRALCDLLGRTEEELVGTKFQLLTHPDDRVRNQALLERALAGKIDRYELEKRFLHLNGDVVWVRLNATMVRDSAGEALYLVSQAQDITEQRRAAEQQRVSAHQLEQSEQLFRALTEQSSEIVYIVDDHAITRYANPAFLELLGYEPEDAIGQSGFKFIREDDVARLQVMFADFLTTPGGVVTTECDFVRKDGGVRRIVAVAQNLLDDPSVAGVVINAHDVTERRRVDAALRESEARRERITANAPGMVYQFVLRPDGSTSFSYASDGARELFGVSPRDIELLRIDLSAFVHHDDRSRYLESIAASARALSPWTWEGRIVLPGGQQKWLRGASRPERQPDGSIMWDGLLMDVTDRRLAVLQLEEGEQRYRSLFDQNPDAVYSFDVDGNFLTANEACERLTGLSNEGLVGKPFAPLIVPEFLDATLAQFRVAANGTATTYESAILHTSGRRVDIAVTNIPIIVDGVVAGVFGIAKDLTEQRALQTKLRQAQKMEAVGRLAGGVAHDFNNILTVIKSYTEMALMDLPPDAPVSADLREVATATGRAAALTRQLLAFSRRQVLQPRRLDLNRTVEDVAGMLQRVIGEDITIRTSLTSDAWHAFADPGQLEQVLMNLAVNARDAMTGGGTLVLGTSNVTVDVNAREPDGPVAGDYAALIVEDTGLGIDATTLPQIFEPFFTTKGPGQGTGLGLATVYGIVKQSGGFIRVESRPGEGSRFTVLLPRTDAPVSGGATLVAASLPEGNETILLVEDEVAVRAAVRRMLVRQGYRVLEASNGSEGLGVATAADARGERIDLVLTDVVMPGKGGRALGEQLAVRWPSLPVLYMSGYTDDEILRRGMMRPGAWFLEKPFTGERLAKAVRRALDEARVVVGPNDAGYN